MRIATLGVIGPLGFFASPEPRGVEQPLGGSVSTVHSLRVRLMFGILLVFAIAVPFVAAQKFTTPPVYTVGGFGVETAAIATGDFNGDGKLDLVAANTNGLDIAVLLNNGDGTFGSPTYYTTIQESNFFGVVVADLNGDGKLDIVGIGSGCCGGQVVIFLGNGDGTFQPGVLYMTGNRSSVSVVAVDMNGDGILDLVVPGQSQAGTGLSVIEVLLGNGNGTFRSPMATTLTYLAGGHDTIVTADFNKDGKADIAMTADDQLLVLLGNGDGTLQAPVNLQLESVPMMAVADMNGDGNPDLLAIADSGVNVILGNGNGTFQAAVATAASILGTQAIAIGDLNGDGKLDVVIGGGNVGNIQTFFGNGTASLGAPTIYATGSGPGFAGAIAVADFNGDGHPDVINSNAVDGDVSVLFGSSSGSLSSVVVSQAIAGPLVVGDFNNDRKADTLTSFIDQPDFYLFLGNGDGVLQPPTTFKDASGVFGTVAADFNGDGKLDVASANQSNVSVGFGNGDGTFQPLVNYTANLGTDTYILAPDVNGDGKPDLAVIAKPHTVNSLIAVMLNDGTGTFLPAVQYSLSGPVQSMTFADFNGDGKIDMVAISVLNPYPLSVFLGNGDGTFQSHVDYGFGLSCAQVIAADVNNDGKQDLVFGCGYIAVALGNGDGTFQPPIFTLAGDAFQVSAADFNGDGKIDILGSGTDVGVYYGNGDGTFTYTNYGLEARDAAVGNFNGDNAPDIVINNGVGVFVLLNNGGTSDVLTSSPNPSKVDQSVTFRAVIQASVAGTSGGVPTGKVTFHDGTKTLATVALQGGVASFKTTALSLGHHTITAVYSGNGFYNRNVSNSLSQKVQQ